MSDPKDLWRKKLEFLRRQEPVVSGAAEKFELQKQIEEIEAKLRDPGEDPDAWRKPPAAPRLPPRPPRCHGREAEVQALVAALCAKRPTPTPLLGGAGVGKSTISLEALHDKRVARRFGARRYFVSCDAATSGEAMVWELARGVGIEVEAVGGGADLAVRVLAELEREPAALVLDNLETPWWAEPGEVEELLGWLGGMPSLALAVSLRGGQRPLKIRWGETIEVEVMPAAAARQTFVEIAGAHLAGDPQLDGLLAAVEHLALAVELLAFQAQGERNLDGLRRRWDKERIRLLRMGKADDRLLNLGASLELSIQSPRMPQAARRLLALLGRLPDGVALEDLPALLDDGDAAAACLRQVGLAAGRSERRLQLLAPVREHVAERHEPEAMDLARASTHYLKLAVLGGRTGRKGGAEAVARLAPELANLEAVITRKLDGAGIGPAVDAAVALGELYSFTGLGGASLLERAEKAARKAGDGGREADAIHKLGDIALYRSDHDEARRRYEAALPLYRRVRSLLGKANCIWRLGDVALRRSDHDEARNRYEDALPLYQQAGSLLGEANCIKSLGDIALYRSDYDEARGRYEEALPFYKRVGDLLGEANCIQRLGDIALRRSDHDEASKGYEAALPLFQRVGSLLGEANCIKSLGDIALRRSDHDEARGRYEEALPLFQRVGYLLGEANCIKSLGDIALYHSDHDEARSRYGDALPFFQRGGDLLGEANCIQRLGDIALRRSDHDEARSRYEDALPLFQCVGDLLGEANCIKGLGDIAQHRSDHDEARSRNEAALPLFQRVGDLLGEGNCRLSLGEMESSPAEARRLAEEALALYGRIPAPYSMARAHEALARLAEEAAERRRHVAIAQELWERIGRPDLVDWLRGELGEDAEASEPPGDRSSTAAGDG